MGSSSELSSDSGSDDADYDMAIIEETATIPLDCNTVCVQGAGCVKANGI